MEGSLSRMVKGPKCPGVKSIVAFCLNLESLGFGHGPYRIHRFSQADGSADTYTRFNIRVDINQEYRSTIKIETTSINQFSL